jgi:peptide/nickel transport system ATP-binding protein
LRRGSVERAGQDEILLDVKDLKKHFPIQRGLFRRVVGYVRAVDGISFFIKKGETLGLVGESGCGKTTTGRCIIRLIEPTDGTVRFRSRLLSPDGRPRMVNLLELGRKEIKTLRREIAMVFQDPIGSLNPRMSVSDIIKEPLVTHGQGKGPEAEERVAQLLGAVGLRPEHMRRYPHEFSGGQRQRIGIARALALNPRLIVCDEPVSALDVSIQAQTLNLLQDLQEEFRLTYLFIAHDLSVIEHISDRVAVMYVGKLVEMAETEELFIHPKHPYTEALMSAVPRPDPLLRSERVVLAGEVANSADPPSGCYFHPRCRYTQERCKIKEPILKEISPEHFVSCHLAEELQLAGVESFS